MIVELTYRSKYAKAELTSAVYVGTVTSQFIRPLSTNGANATHMNVQE